MRRQTKLRAAVLAASALVVAALAAPSAAFGQAAAGEYDLALPQSGPKDPADAGGASASSAGGNEEATPDAAGAGGTEEQPQGTAGGGGGEESKGTAGGNDTKSAKPSGGDEPAPLAGSTPADDGSGSSSLPLLLGLLAAIAVAGIAATIWRRRRAADSAPDAIGTQGVGESRAR
jgi:cobalamin biosynthesis Mg chelatase CobN